MWPEKCDSEAPARIKANTTAQDWAALYQQEPTQDVGSYFKEEWLIPILDLPPPPIGVLVNPTKSDTEVAAMRRQRFSEVPFFWSQHYDVPINYIGHAETWDDLDIEGDIEARDCLVRYRRNGKLLAVASIFRDVDNLREETAMEHAG